jgi:signal transduction histidine kinase
MVLVNIIGGEARLVSVSAGPAGRIFLAWLALSLVSSAWVCFRQVRRVRDVHEERLFRMLFWGTVLVAAAIMTSPLLMVGKAATLRPAAESDLIVSLAALFPGVVFAYYVYRHNYLEFVLRRSIFYAFLTLLIIGIYYFLIRELSLWLGERVEGLNVPLVEALLVIGLVYLFPRMGQAVRRLLRLLVFRRIADAQQRLSTLNQEVLADPMVEPQRALERVCRVVKEACKVRSTAILLRGDGRVERYGDRPAQGFTEESFAAVLAACETSGAAWLERQEVSDVPCLTAMRRLGAYSVYPIVQAGRHRGFIAVGRAPAVLPLSEDASEQLVVMANRIASAMGRAQLIQETLRLQRRLYEREKLVSLGQLAASVAHEVRNPLSSIKSLVQCLTEELEARGIEAEESELIVEEINRLNRTVSGLLRYARPGGDGQRPADFADTLQTVLRVLRHEFERRGCELRVDVPEDLPPVRADEDEVKEVLFNLILNALEAMPEGGSLTVSARAGDGRLSASVTDTGGGIPEELRERVFEPAFTTKEGGSGLGLSIVRERLRQAGGAIACRSSSSGTVMELELPLAAADDGSP